MSIFTLEEMTGSAWTALRDAQETSRNKRLELESLVGAATSDDVSFVVFGSLGRDEYTVGSDLDWTLLIDGQASPNHHDLVSSVKNSLSREKGPGREGLFGGLAFSHDLIHRIGGGDDSNRNTTQRLLLLLEGTAIGNKNAFERVRKAVLARYLHEDFGWLHHNREYAVPRFLHNDFARYWRTMAVDFAFKRRERHGSGWALRTVKLRMSRKLIYVAGMVACFYCEIDKDKFLDESSQPIVQAMVAYVHDLLVQTPLEIVASLYIRFPDLLPHGRALFTSYDKFIAMLADSEKREYLDNLPSEEAATDALYNEARENGHIFQNALLDTFMSDNGTPLFKLTRAYGVF